MTADHAVRIDPERLAELLEARVGPGEPGLAVGVAQGGATAFEAAYGLADLATARPLTTATAMAVGSITKHMTALAWLLLCENGRAAIDDPIGHFLPSLAPDAGSASAADLLGHISGLRDAAELSMIFDGFAGRVPLTEILNLYRSLASVDAPPRTRWSYNNGGYLLLSAALEHAWDAPLEMIFSDHILTPAGLSEAYLQRFDFDAPSDRARLYRKAGSQFLATARSVEGLGQGGLTASVRDLLRWTGQFGGRGVGSAASWDYLMRPMRLASGAATGYGAGIRLATYRGLPIVHHPGAVPGGQAQMIKVPSLDLDIVVLANRQDVSAIDIANAMLDELVTGLAPCPLPAPAPQVEGLFRSAATGRVVALAARCDRAELRLDGQALGGALDDAGALRPVTGGMMRAEHIFADPREPDRLDFDLHGHAQCLTRVPAATGPGRLHGRYHVPGTALRLDVGIAEEAARAQGACGQADYWIEAVGTGVAALQATGSFPMQVILAADDDGALSLRNPRVRSLRLEEGAA